jgi:hypothetical protein
VAQSITLAATTVAAVTFAKLAVRMLFPPPVIFTCNRRNLMRDIAIKILLVARLNFSTGS